MSFITKISCSSITSSFTFVLPQLWGDVAVSSIKRDGDGQDVMDVWGWLGWQSEPDGVPCNPKRPIGYLVLIEDCSWLQLCVRGNKIRRFWWVKKKKKTLTTLSISAKYWSLSCRQCLDLWAWSVTPQLQSLDTELCFYWSDFKRQRHFSLVKYFIAFFPSDVWKHHSKMGAQMAAAVVWLGCTGIRVGELECDTACVRALEVTVS